jgi:hypothetical protein
MPQITLNAQHINTLDLAPARSVITPLLPDLAQDPKISFAIDYPRDADDPRELSEISEIRLWFIRLDVEYPWLPYLLDWEGGELGRYVAMLVPHQFSPAEGIQYNPQALEIFMMSKVFAIAAWTQQQGIASRTKLKFMTQLLGYELDDGFFEWAGI